MVPNLAFKDIFYVKYKNEFHFPLKVIFCSKFSEQQIILNNGQNNFYR